ncbi:MAG: CBS domain-containing protein [Phycisphaerales bacterium]
MGTRDDSTDSRIEQDGADQAAMQSAPGDSTVESLMTRHVISVSPDTPLKGIRDIFEMHQFHHVTVVDQDKLVGIISDRDVLRAISPMVDRPAATRQDLATLGKRAHQIMQRQLVTARPEMPIVEAGQIMLAQNISSLPVVDSQGRCVGIITSHDFMRWCTKLGCAMPRAAA